MKIIKRILIAIAILILGAIGFLVSEIILISKPTHGKPIAHYEQPQKALLVIDVQEDFTGTTAKPPFPYPESEQLIETVNRITEAAYRENIPIIYIRQEMDGFPGEMLSNLIAGGIAIKGNPGTQIDKRVSVISDHIFPKHRSDAFSNPKFEAFLIKNQVNELILIGLDADGCVHATARGALNRGYTVSVVTDAVALMAKDKWEKLLKQYQEEGIRLIKSDGLITD